MHVARWLRGHLNAVIFAAVPAFCLSFMMLFLTTPASINLDYYGYTLIAHVFSLQFHEGDWYPRWLDFANGGLGSPVGIFSPAIGNFLVAIAQFLPFEDRFSLHYYNITFALSMFGLMLAMYQWMYPRLGERGALMSMLVLACMPTVLWCATLAGSIYGIIGLISIVKCMHHVDAAARNQRFAIFSGLTLWASLLILSHPPAALCFFPGLFIYSWFVAEDDRLKCLRWMVASIALAALLSAFYWLPLFVSSAYINADLYTEWGKTINTANVFGMPTTPFSFVDQVYLLYTFFALTAYTMRCLRESSAAMAEELRGLWACFIVWMLLASPIGQALLSLFGLWDKIQFRGRFYVVAMLPLAGILASAMMLRRRLIKNIVLYSLVTMTAFNIGNVYESGYYLYSDPVRIAREQNIFVNSSDELRTLWQSKREVNANPDEPLKDLLSLPPVRVTKGKAVLSGELGIGSPLPGTARSFTVDVQSEQATVVLREYYFPLTELRDVNTHARYDVSPSPEGLILATLPHGKHTLELVRHTPGAPLGNLISLVGLALLVGAALCWCRARTREIEVV